MLVFPNNSGLWDLVLLVLTLLLIPRLICVTPKSLLLLKDGFVVVVFMGFGLPRHAPLGAELDMVPLVRLGGPFALTNPCLVFLGLTPTMLLK